MHMDVIKYKDQAIQLAMVYAPKVLLALVTLIIGLWLIGGVRTVVGKALSRKRVDKTLAPFVLSLLVWVLKAVLFISVASMIGIETTSFVAILGAAGLAVGLALQGSLSKFAALGNGPIVNHTVEGTARVDLTIPIEYQADPEKARQILLEMLAADKRVLSAPAPAVLVMALGDTVTLAIRPHCKVDDYWGLYCDTLEQGKARLEQAGIGIPYLAREVHVPSRKSA